MVANVSHGRLRQDVREMVVRGLAMTNTNCAFVKSSFLIDPVCDILCRQFNRAGMPGPALLPRKAVT
jgi:hypothetical protein